jgi:hypothetical protein
MAIRPGHTLESNIAQVGTDLVEIADKIKAYRTDFADLNGTVRTALKTQLNARMQKCVDELIALKGDITAAA